MRLHILSDLHIEFAPFEPPAVDADLIVLAGDIHVGTTALQWARNAFPDQQIVFVPGNHEFYGHDIERLSREMRALARDVGITYLDNDVVAFHEHGVRIIGVTLWTDFELFGSSAGAVASAQKAAGIHIRDFGVIRHGVGYLTPAKTVDFHATAKEFIAAELAKPFDGKTVVVTRLFQRLPLLEALLTRCPDVSIVISSSWQEHYSLPELRTLLGAAGEKVIGTTRSTRADHVDATNRYEECHVAADALGAYQWLLLDDQPSIVWGSHVPNRDEMAHAVFCDPILGLTPMIVEHVARKLA